MHFDRFDICEAWAVLEWDWHVGGWLRERASNQRRRESCGVQLIRLRFRPHPTLCYETLTENGRAIYDAAEKRLRLRQSGQGR